MRALITSPALVVLGILLVWSVTNRTQANCELAGRFLSHRAILTYLIFGACANLFVAALAGYINPMDYVQDVVAARQFLKHETMYPDNLPQMGFAELSAPMPGREELRKLSIFQGELKAATFSPAPGNAHPPDLGIVLAAPVFLLGLRGSFLFVLSLSAVLLYLTTAAILRELFPSLSLVARCAVMAFAFGWYPVAAALREGQPAIILFALITTGWLMLRRNRPRNREWIAGGAIGLAACLQAFPALLMLFVAIRYRRAFVAALGTIALLNLAAATVAVKGTFQQWQNSVAMISRDSVPSPGNLSIAGLITGFSRGMGWDEHVKIVAPAMLLTIAGALVFFLTRNRRGAQPEMLDVEYSVFVTAMLLASPLTWERYLPIMLLPLAVIVRNWRTRHATWELSALLAALFFMSFSTSAFMRAYQLLSGSLGFISGWLAISAPSFSMMAILFWLGARD
jgi:hypothetical protein